MGNARRGAAVALMLGLCACVSGLGEAPPIRPPAAPPETHLPPPGPGQVWVAGSWHWDDRDWAWIPGRWETAPPAAVPSLPPPAPRAFPER